MQQETSPPGTCPRDIHGDALAKESLRDLLSRRNLLLAAFIVCWGFIRFCGPGITDDAFITYQYSRNLIEGAGLVHEPGQWVLGTTTPLYALFCAAGMVLRFPPWTWSLLTDVAWMGIVLWRIRQVHEAADRGRWFPLAAVLLLISSPVTLPVAGMETGLYMALIFSSLAVMARRGPPGRALAWAAGAFLLRPDGALIFLLATWHLGTHCKCDWKAFLRAMAPSLVVLAVFALALVVLYGSPVPQSLQSKSGSSILRPFQQTFLGGMYRFFVQYYNAPGLVLLAGLILLVGAGRSPAIRPVRNFVLLYIAAFSIGKAPDFVWYDTPMVVILTAAGGASAGWLAEKLTGWMAVREPAGSRRWLAGAAAWVIALGLLAPQMNALLSLTARGARQWGRIDTDPFGFRSAGGAIAAESEGGDPLIASHEVGALAYFSRCRIFDMEGLVTRHADGEERDLERLAGPGGAGWFVHRFPLGGEAVEHQRYYRLLQVAGFEERHRFRGDQAEFVTVVFRSKASSGGGLSRD